MDNGAAAALSGLLATGLVSILGLVLTVALVVSFFILVSHVKRQTALLTAILHNTVILANQALPPEQRIAP